MGREHDFRFHPARRAPGPTNFTEIPRLYRPADKFYDEFHEILTWANTIAALAGKLALLAVDGNPSQHNRSGRDGFARTPLLGRCRCAGFLELTLRQHAICETSPSTAGSQIQTCRSTRDFAAERPVD